MASCNGKMCWAEGSHKLKRSEGMWGTSQVQHDGDTPALLWDLSQVHVHRTRQHGRQTGGLTSPCTVTGLPCLRGYRDMAGSLTTGVLQCMDTDSSGKIGCEGRLSVRHYISCQQVLQAPECHLTLSFLGFLQICFGPSCDHSYF